MYKEFDSAIWCITITINVVRKNNKVPQDKNHKYKIEMFNKKLVLAGVCEFAEVTTLNLSARFTQHFNFKKTLFAKPESVLEKSSV